MALTQLLLTIPVMIIDLQSYRVGFKTFIKRAPNMDALIAVVTSAAIQELLALIPDEAIVLVDGLATIIPLSEVKVGDTLIVKPGGKGIE